MSKKPGPDFRQYLKQLGLQDAPAVTKAQLEREKAAARAVGERVASAFSRGARKLDT